MGPKGIVSSTTLNKLAPDQKAEIRQLLLLLAQLNAYDSSYHKLRLGRTRSQGHRRGSLQDRYRDHKADHPSGSPAVPSPPEQDPQVPAVSSQIGGMPGYPTDAVIDQLNVIHRNCYRVAINPDQR